MAGRVLPAEPASLLLAGGALNKLLQSRDAEQGAHQFMSVLDAQEGFLMSDCSLFIDAAHSEARPTPKPARRWLQVSSQRCHSAPFHANHHPEAEQKSLNQRPGHVVIYFYWCACCLKDFPGQTCGLR